MSMTAHIPAIPEDGAVLAIPLNRLKKSPRNARKTPHRADAIEALAASIAAKKMLQCPIVEPELDDDEQPTGFYLVTIGEGRRQAQLLRAKRKEIKKTEPIRCIVDTKHDAHEISLDENVTRTAMHPADQFEAFQRLADERSLSADDIATRFGVTATLVRQRLRLASVSPTLMQTYRGGDMTLDQLMAFTLTEDHARQETLWESLPSWDCSPSAIRRHLTADRVSADDRCAIFVGLQAYQAAGGIVERDLFSEDGGGYLADPALLERLVLERLQALADGFTADGWKWASASVSYASDHGCARIYAEVREFTADEQARYDALAADVEALDAAEWTEAVQSRAADLSAQIDALDTARSAFSEADKARAGVLVSVGRDGAARIDYGLIRPEDDERDEAGENTDAQPAPGAPKRTPLSDKLVTELTAHRTAGLRDALALQPETAFLALLHLLVLRVFDLRQGRSCLDIRLAQVRLSGYAPGIAEGPALQAVEARHHKWAARLAAHEADLWAFLAGLSHEEALGLLAHCVSLSVNAMHTTDRAWTGQEPADDLARTLSLDMGLYWSPTADSYFNRVSKARIEEAVAEGRPGDELRIAGGKKADMAKAAEGLVQGTGWLPEPLRTPTEEPEPSAAE